MAKKKMQRWDDYKLPTEGLAVVHDKNNFCYGYIDMTGQEVIAPQWNGAEPFSDGKAAVMDDSYKKGYIDRTGKLVIALPDGDVALTTEDVEVSMAQTEGFNCQRYNGVTIALDTTLTEELLEEGFVREIISKVQTMRKENGFEVTDHIKVSLSGNEKLQAIVAKNEDYLKEITLADSVAYGTLAGEAKEWNINGENVTIAVE